MTQDFIYCQTGQNENATPRYEPNARGLFIAFSREIAEDDMVKVNLHAQRVLLEQSADFAKAKAHWDALPHTPERQLDNCMCISDPVSEADEVIAEWFTQFKSYPGVVYAFDYTTRLNLVTGEIEPRIPGLLEISFGMGGMSMQPFDAATEKDCVEYRILFVFAEKE